MEQVRRFVKARGEPDRSPEALFTANLALSIMKGAELCLSGKTFRYNNRAGFTIQSGNSEPWITVAKPFASNTSPEFIAWRNELRAAVVSHYSSVITPEFTWAELCRRCINRDYGESSFSFARA